MKDRFPARFSKFVEHTILSEIGADPKNDGGWTNHASDHGGPTQWGIAANYNKGYAARIRNKRLTKDEAKQVYYEKYYKPIFMVDKLPAPIAFLLFDAKVHGSIRSTVKDLQSLTNFVSGSNLKLDGVYGPNTYRAISRLSEPQLESVLSMMKMTVPFRASRVAKATMRTQVRKGLKPLDYTEGFEKRFKDRIRQAMIYA